MKLLARPRFRTSARTLVWLHSSRELKNATGALVGHIEDRNAASIVRAKVTVTNVGTHQGRATTSNASGNYTVALLPPGTYDVSITAPGFKTATQTGLSKILHLDTLGDMRVTIYHC